MTTLPLDCEGSRYLALTLLAQAMREYKKQHEWRVRIKKSVGRSRFFEDEESDLPFWCELAGLDKEAVLERYRKIKRKLGGGQKHREI